LAFRTAQPPRADRHILKPAQQGRGGQPAMPIGNGRANAQGEFSMNAVTNAKPGIGAAMRVLVVLALTMPVAGHAQPVIAGRWADPADPVAQHLIDLERTWSLLSCDTGANRAATAAAFYQDFIADDFVGTSPEGPLYTKADLIPAKPAATPPEPETACQFLGAKVRFFGQDMAVLYGRESAMIKGRDGKTTTRVLIWTDTL
jgi:hypothetical protein